MRIPKSESKTVEFKTSFNKMDACREHGEVVPEFKDMGTWFRVVLRKISGNSQGDMNGGINGGIKRAVADNPGIGVSQLSKIVGVSVRTVQRAVADLKSRELLSIEAVKKPVDITSRRKLKVGVIVCA